MVNQAASAKHRKKGRQHAKGAGSGAAHAHSHGHAHGHAHGHGHAAPATERGGAKKRAAAGGAAPRGDAGQAVQPVVPAPARGRNLWQLSWKKLQALSDSDKDSLHDKTNKVIPEALVAQARGLERQNMEMRLRGNRPSTPPGVPPGRSARTGKDLWAVCRVRVKHMNSLKNLWGDTRKLYGHHSGEYETKDSKLRKHMQGRKCFYLPTHRVRVYWDLVQVPLLLYIAIMTPLREGFGLSVGLPSATNPCCSASFVSELMIDLYFAVDIVLNFRTAYHDDKGEVVVEQRRVTQHYLRRWFLVDFMSILPVSYIGILVQGDDADEEADGKLKFMKMLRLFRLAKMLRLARMKRLLERYDEAWQELQSVSQLLKSLVLCLFSAHLIGCFWYALGDTSQKLPSGHLIHGWVKDHEMSFGWDNNTTLSTKYITATYWAVTTLTTVGYGDILPYTDAERLFTIICMLVGVIFFGAMVGTLGQLINKSQPHVEMYRDNMAEIRDFCQLKGLPRTTKAKILSFYDHKFKTQTVFSEQTILNELPPSMRHDLIGAMYRELIEAVPLFHGLPEDVIHMICMYLHPMPVQKGDVIIREGAIGTEMYIVKSGEVKVTMKNDAPVDQWNCAQCGKTQARVEVPFKCSCAILGSCDYCADDTRKLICAKCANEAQSLDDSVNISNETVLGFLKESSFFGEGPMVGAGGGHHSNLRTRTVTASQDTTLYYLHKYDIEGIAEMHEELGAHLNQFAVKRDNRDRRETRTSAQPPGDEEPSQHEADDVEPSSPTKLKRQQASAIIDAFAGAQKQPPPQERHAGGAAPQSRRGMRSSSGRSRKQTSASAVARPHAATLGGGRSPFGGAAGGLEALVSQVLESQEATQETQHEEVQGMTELSAKVDNFQQQMVEMRKMMEKIAAGASAIPARPASQGAVAVAAAAAAEAVPTRAGGVPSSIVHRPIARKMQSSSTKDPEVEEDERTNWLRDAQAQAPELAARILQIDLRFEQLRAAEVQRAILDVHGAARSHQRAPQPEPEPEPEPELEAELEALSVTIPEATPPRLDPQ
jgi:CRP-like cAMP-binding protein